MRDKHELKFSTRDSAYRVLAAKEILYKLENMCRILPTEETGGIIVGYYSDDLRTAIITEVTSPPADSKKGFSWFIRGIEGLRSLLKERWGQARRTFYIGEWHYHPSAIVEPSSDDFEQMRQISKTKKYQCREPMMIILGKSENSTRPLRIFLCAQGNIIEELFP